MKNMYEFVDIRWNPVKGKCLFNCSYCYVGRWGNKQKPIHLDEKDMRRNLGKDNFIFVCSGCDLFHPSVPWAFIADVLRVARDQYPDNTYMWHTKNPARALEIPMFQYPKKSVLCVTVETDMHMAQISAAPAPIDRINALKQWKGEKMIAIEPIMDFDLGHFSQMIIEAAPAQVNIGADSGHNRLPEPSAEKIEALINALKPPIIVHLKDNLSRIYKKGRNAPVHYGDNVSGNKINTEGGDYINGDKNITCPTQPAERQEAPDKHPAYIQHLVGRV